jgi:hypothetical protein
LNAIKDSLALMSTGIKIWISVIGIVLIVAVSGVGFGHSVLKDIETRGGLTAILQKTLSDDDAGIVSSIQSTSFDFQLSAAPFRLVAENIELNAENTTLILPRAEFGFSITNLFTWNLLPSDLQLSGLEIEIRHGDDGWYTGPSMALILALMREDAAGVNGNSALESFKNIFIRDARVIVNKSALDDTSTPEKIVLEPIDVKMRHVADRFIGSIDVNNPGGGAFVINFDGLTDGSEINLSTSLYNIDMAMIYPYLGLNIPEIKDLGLIDGAVTMTIESQEITALSGDLITKDGETVLPSIGKVTFSEASINFTYDTIEDLLSVANFDINAVRIEEDGSRTATGKMNFSGQIRELLSARPVVLAKVLGGGIPFSRLVNIWPEGSNPGLRDRITEVFRGGIVQSLGLNMVGILHREQNRFDVTTFDVVADLSSVRFETGFASIENIVGNLNARLELSIGTQGEIEHAAVNLLLLDAKLLTENSDNLVDLEGVEIRAILDGNVLRVVRGAIDAKSLGQMVLAAEIQIDQDWTPRRLDMNVKAEQIDKNFLVSLWPEGISRRTRHWVASRIHGGQINGLTMNMGIDIPREASADVIYLDGKAQITGADMTYRSGMPDLTGLHTSLAFEKDYLRADVTEGQSAGLEAAGSRMIIRNSEFGPLVDLAIISEGNFGGAVALLDSPPLGFLKKAGLNVTEAGGDVTASLSLKWRIPPENQSIRDVGGINLNVTAEIINASMNGLPQGIELTASDMEASMSGGKLSLSGRGAFDGAPGQFNLFYDRAGDTELEIDMPKSDELTAAIGNVLNVDLLGSSEGTLQARREKGSELFVVNTRVDFVDAAINLDQFGLTKLPGEPAELIGDFTARDGHLREVTRLDLESEFLSINGTASFDEDGEFLGAYFGEVAWPGNDIREITIEQNGEGVIRVSAVAEFVDLTPLRRRESTGEGVALEIDLTANRFILDDRVDLSGNVELKTKEDGTGRAKFQGNLFLNGKPFMTESTLRANFGSSSGEVMEGRGLIGGAEASLSISPSEAGGHLMVLRSDNAGQVLKTLKVVDAIRSGKLYMVAEFHPGAEDHATIDFELEDFRIIEAPTTVRMLSVLSLAGLYSLVEGDGTEFSLGYARVETKEDLQIIHQARASGAALAIDLVGVIMPKTRELEVSGALLPIYGITTLIGNLPILGQILTGVNKEGLLVTQFTIDGTLDEPETIINSSSVIPGIFRDVLSPNWIKSEHERLILNGNGSDNHNDNSSSAAPPAGEDDNTGSGTGAGAGN